MTTPADGFDNGAELNVDMPEVGQNEITVGELTGDEPTAYAEAADHSIAVEDFGTTEAEMAEGESLDGRLARELPDITVDTPEDSYGEGVQTESDPGESDPGEGGPTGLSLDGEDFNEELIGRLVEPSEGARADTTSESFASDLGSDGGGFSAEESAMHIDPDS